MIGIFFGGRAYSATFGNTFGNFELDATLEEGHEWRAEATTNPVENGAPIADHVIRQPDRLTLRGLVSDAPLIASASAMSGMINGQPNSARVQSAFDLLRKLMDEKEPVTVYTKMRIYREMIISSVSINRRQGQGEVLEFTAEFVAIRMVSTQLVDIPPGIGKTAASKSSGAVARKSAPAKNAGAVQAKPAPTMTSTLSRTFGALAR